MLQSSTRIFTASIALGFFACENAHAYLDPSSITAATQLLAALCTSAVLGFLFFKNQCVIVFCKLRDVLRKRAK